jgi:hypothetical protein
VNALPFEATKYFVNLILNHSSGKARLALHRELVIKKSNEGQLYQAIIEHQRGLCLTTDQWFELLSRLPNRMLRSGLNLNGLLSEEQIMRLPPVTG